MRMNRNRLWLILAFTCYALTSVAQEYTVIDDIRYKVISDTEAEVVYYKKVIRKATVFIPETVKIGKNIYTVVGIGYGAFNSSEGENTLTKTLVLPNTIRYIEQTDLMALETVNLPEGLKELRNGAFRHAQLEKVVLPEGLETIDNNAFIGCKSLKEISFPSSLKRIGREAFRGCESLQKVSFARSMDSQIDIEVGAFYGSSLKSIEIPEGVEVIGNGAFCNCALLEEVKLPESLKVIGSEAFNRCKSLKTIEIPNSVVEVGRNAFILCEALQEVKIPDKAKFVYKDEGGRIGRCFELCENIEKVSGYSQQYPHYDYKDIFDYRCPFMRGIDDLYKSLTYYGSGIALERIEKWQQKQEFETTAQWKARVSERSRQAKLKEIIAQAREDYIKEFTPETLSTDLSPYDADRGVFGVDIKGEKDFNVTVYVPVPLSEAQSFKNNWTSSKVNPTYGIVDDHLALVACSFDVNGKTYESTNHYTEDDSESNLAINLPPLQIDFSSGENGGRKTAKSQPRITQRTTDNSVDRDIPRSTTVNDRAFAVIIGNENYERVERVEFARNDAQVFAEYCRKTLGMPEQNVSIYEDATYGTMLSALQHVKDVAEVYGGDLDIIFYYAGHGVPNESSRNAYLLPIDMDGRQTEACLPTSRLYSELGGLKARNVVIFMDACFSGSQRGEGMLAAARGIALRVKSDVPQGNMVVFTAASGDETAYPYQEKGHGLFTYFLLKKLQETKGSVALGELTDYVIEQVQRQSVIVNYKRQTPTVTTSPDLADSWRTINLP